jgi:hypothetical protein
MPRKYPKSKESIDYQKRWWEENKHKKNKERIRENNRKYSKTEKGKRKIKIRDWREKGMICNDWDKFYDKYLLTTHCESCNLEFGNERCNRRNVDHQHSSGHIRNIICHSCNSFRSKYDNQLGSVLLEIHRFHFLKK